MSFDPFCYLCDSLGSTAQAKRQILQVQIFLHHILHIVFNVSKANFQTLISIEFIVFFWDFLKNIYLALRTGSIVTQPLKPFKVKNGKTIHESFFHSSFAL